MCSSVEETQEQTKQFAFQKILKLITCSWSNIVSFIYTVLSIFRSLDSYKWKRFLGWFNSSIIKNIA